VSKAILQAKTSTDYERLALESTVDLSNGHSRLRLTPSQETIVSRFSQLYWEAGKRSQSELECEFVDAFFLLAGQGQQFSSNQYFLSYSASSAIEMLASFCRRHHKEIALIEPTFDSIPSILQREGLPLEVIPEADLYETDIAKLLASLTANVIWLVQPNNPTSRFLDEAKFTEVVRFCAENNKLLICDFCFRFFSRDMLQWSQYDILKQSNVSFVTIEDTGKTWSALDIKMGILVCSEDVTPEMYRLHNDLLLNVSPFQLRVLTEFIKDTYHNGLETTIWHHAVLNRKNLRAGLAGSVLEPVTTDESAPAREWFRINARFSGEDLWDVLKDRGIHILPGSNFYWSNPDVGRHYIRIPLTRDPNLILQAIPAILEAVNDLLNKNSKGN